MYDLLPIAAILFFNWRQPVSFYNFFLAYLLLMFGFAGLIFYGSPLVADLFAILFPFLLGYTFYNFVIRKYLRPSAYCNASIGEEPSPQKIYSARNLAYKLLAFIAALNILRIIALVLSTGLSDYLSGSLLRDQISSYGVFSPIDAFQAVLSAVLNIFQYSTLFLYLFLSKRLDIRPSYVLVYFLLLGGPILSLSRSSFVAGSIFMVFFNTYYCTQNCLRSSGFTLSSFLRRISMPLVIILALSIAILFGQIRDSGFASNSATSSTSTPFDTAVNIVSGEYSTVIAYSEIKENEEVLGYQYGKTIFEPFLFKMFPRGIFPNKPLNSSALYMTTLRPKEAQAGFYLAPTLFGDLWLNFGNLSLFFYVLLGSLVAWMDCAIRSLAQNESRYFTLFYASLFFYGFLRNNLSESLFSLFSLAIAYSATRKLVFKGIKL
jgi:hypothetical protein